MCAEKITPIDRDEERFVPLSPVILATAERELAAFISAVDKLFGPAVTPIAAEYWMEELNRVDWSLPRTDPNWRSITIAAAARLAEDDVEPVVRVENGVVPRGKATVAKITAFESSTRGLVDQQSSSLNIREPERRGNERWFANENALDGCESRRLVGECQSELRRKSLELRAMEPLAETGKMAHLISHDLRNHLSAVYSNVQFMNEPKIYPAERKKLQEEVFSAIHDMTDMLDSLLLFAQTGQALHPRREMLNLLVEHAVSMVRIHPDARGVDLTVEDMSYIEGWVDAKKLCRAVYNLLLNACQAAKRGLSPGKVGVALAEEEGLVRIRVVDNGPGVPASLRKTIYEPFVSCETKNGIGLGLTIAERTAREHGGFVGIEESKPGRTVFALHLLKQALKVPEAIDDITDSRRDTLEREPVCISTFTKRLSHA